MKTIVDTSVWIDHFKTSNPRLIKLLENDDSVIHPFSIGELICGNISDRIETVRLLKKLPLAAILNEPDLEYFVDRNRLYGKGLGFVDCHLLGSAVLSKCDLYTFDKTLAKAFMRLASRNP